MYESKHTNSDGKTKRSYISSVLIMDGVYERMSKHGKTLRKIQEESPEFYKEHKLYQYPDQNIRWESLNHLEEELNEYERRFDIIVKNERVENHGTLHIDSNCFCGKCVLLNKLNKNSTRKYTYDQLVKVDNTHYIKIDEKFWPVSLLTDTLFN